MSERGKTKDAPNGKPAALLLGAFGLSKISPKSLPPLGGAYNLYFSPTHVELPGKSYDRRNNISHVSQVPRAWQLPREHNWVAKGTQSTVQRRTIVRTTRRRLLNLGIWPPKVAGLY